MSSVRILLHPKAEDLALPNVLHALGDPIRLEIVGQLATSDEGVSCGDIPACKALPKSTISHHFKVLRESGLVRMMPQGRRVLVSLRREELAARFPGLLESVLKVYQT